MFTKRKPLRSQCENDVEQICFHLCATLTVLKSSVCFYWIIFHTLGYMIWWKTFILVTITSPGSFSPCNLFYLFNLWMCQVAPLPRRYHGLHLSFLHLIMNWCLFFSVWTCESALHCCYFVSSTSSLGRTCSIQTSMLS